MINLANKLLESSAGIGQINIMLVDDNKSNLSSMENILMHERRNILCASSGEEAIEYAHAFDIALIIIDDQMEEMNGGRLSKRLKEDPATKDVPIVFIATRGKQDNLVSQGYEGSIVDYLFKPLEINAVANKVRIFEKLYLQKMDLKSYAERVVGINK